MSTFNCVNVYLSEDVVQIVYAPWEASAVEIEEVHVYTSISA